MLLQELKALKDIVFEMSGGRVNEENNWGKSKKTGRRALSEARHYSQLHYNNGDEKDLTSFNAVYDMKHFTSEIVADMGDSIRDCFEAERKEIFREIDRLNDSLDGNCEELESEPKVSKSFEKISLSSPSPVPTEKMDLCSMCSLRKPPIVDLTTGKSIVLYPFICSACQLARQKREVKLGTSSSSSSSSNSAAGIRSGTRSMSHSQSTPAHLSAEMSRLDISIDTNSPAFQYNKRSNNEDSPDAALTSAFSVSKSSPRSSGGGAASKFRNRLDSARHEHHFLDEF